MDDTVDLLQIKIEQAKAQLPEDTLNAIAAVDWQAAIFGMREKYGYNFEQLESLDLETELLLCGLLSPRDYPREIEKRMGISRIAADELVKEMNEMVFSKIKEELIKNTERKKIFQKNEQKNDSRILNDAGIKIVKESSDFSSPDKGRSGGVEFNSPHPDPLLKGEGGNSVETRDALLKKIEDPAPTNEVHPLLAQKLVASVQNPKVKTEYSLNNISKTASSTTVEMKPSSSYPKNADPYRLPPE